MTDIGVSCAKKSYGRGVGYGLQSGDCDAAMLARCEAQNGKGNCEKNGEIFYPKCKFGYHNFGCCVWSVEY
jgi:hypothetical protein